MHEIIVQKNKIVVSVWEVRLAEFLHFTEILIHLQHFSGVQVRNMGAGKNHAFCEDYVPGPFLMECIDLDW